ncbi:MAG: SGNH/GDSL hydrolase family protein [Candidatus Thiodiazotropha sp. (ex. Lucinisca nassula)]|nr:SGNH/GDSL hydrolase family protein [Candidatus Thiodiazotropha sp. (ex. Lucinisca nassula)]
MLQIKQYLNSNTAINHTILINNPTDDPNKPNILIIGDSISQGYTPYVRKLLESKVDVFRIPENARHTGYGIRKLNEWLSLEKHWEVIHFNWGLWDLKYIEPTSNHTKGIQRHTEFEYKKNMEHLIKELKKTNAKLIWCNTTPIPDNTISRVKGDELNYNDVVLEIMKENKIIINDLHSFALQDINKIQIPNNIHFSEYGYQYLSKKVADEIVKALTN